MDRFLRTTSAVIAAAAIAGTITVLPSFSDRVDASAPITVAMAAAPVPVVTDRCAEQHWPYMDTECVRDNRRAQGQAAPASRVVNIDRKMARQFEITVIPGRRDAASPEASLAKTPGCLDFCQLKRFTASTAFNPPNANEFDSAASTFMLRAVFGTQSMSQAGSGPI
jgi:hypothetical protein